MKPVAIAFALLLAAGSAAAQPAKGRAGQVDGKAQQMSQEERERMRQDMRNAYGKGGKAKEQGRMQQMSPEERQKLRHDIQDANKSLKR